MHGDRGTSGLARTYPEYGKPKLILSNSAFTDTLSTDVSILTCI